MLNYGVLVADTDQVESPSVLIFPAILFYRVYRVADLQSAHFAGACVPWYQLYPFLANLNAPYPFFSTPLADVQPHTCLSSLRNHLGRAHSVLPLPKRLYDLLLSIPPAVLIAYLSLVSRRARKHRDFRADKNEALLFGSCKQQFPPTSVAPSRLVLCS